MIICEVTQVLCGLFSVVPLVCGRDVKGSKDMKILKIKNRVKFISFLLIAIMLITAGPVCVAGAEDFQEEFAPQISENYDNTDSLPEGLESSVLSEADIPEILRSCSHRWKCRMVEGFFCPFAAIWRRPYFRISRRIAAKGQKKTRLGGVSTYENSF